MQRLNLSSFLLAGTLAGVTSLSLLLAGCASPTDSSTKTSGPKATVSGTAKPDTGKPAPDTGKTPPKPDTGKGSSEKTGTTDPGTTVVRADAKALTIGYSDWPGWIVWEIAMKMGYFDES
jgi:hypothetical protein